MTSQSILCSSLTLLTMLTCVMGQGGQQVPPAPDNLYSCYNCQGSSFTWYTPVGVCSDNLANASRCLGGYCVKHVVKYYTGGMTVSRYCTNVSSYANGCIFDSSNVIQGWTWYCVCNGPNCNGAQKLKTGLLTLPLLAAAILIVKMIAK
jgi:hypothetical protein